MSKSATNRKWTSTPESRRNWDRIFRGIDTPAETPFKFRFIMATTSAMKYLLRRLMRNSNGSSNT